MTVQPIKGVQVLEVAQYTFVPSTGAVLAATLSRTPLFAEHTYDILKDLDFKVEAIAKMMSKGAVA